jgi:hypothetical protein
MPTAKQAVTILAPTEVPAGRTVASPVWGPAVDVTGFMGGEWGYIVKNGTSGPPVGCTIVLQTSPDGVNDWTDYYTITGDTQANGGIARSVTMSHGVMWARVGGYGNTTNAVTISSKLQARVS